MRIHTEEENLPDKKLVSRQKIGPDGTVVSVYEEQPVDLKLERIAGVTPPPREIEEAVKPTPTKSKLKDHRLVEDPQLWGTFKEVGVPRIYGNQPNARDIPATSGRPVATRSETMTETGLLRRTIERLIGAKEK